MMIVNPTAPANSEGDSFPRDAELAALFHNVLGQHQLLLKWMRDQGEPDRDPPPEPYYSEEAGDVPPQGQDYEVESEPSPETASEGVISGSAKPPVGMDVARIKEHFGIPNLDELDILNAPVDDGNPDTPDTSPTDKAWVALIEDYRARIESGDLEKDSPQARLVRALDAKAALEQGRDIWAYREDWFLGGTLRNFDDAPTHLTPADMEAFFKEGAVDEALAELLADEGILADYESALQDELDRLPDEAKSEIVAQIEELVSSPEYAQYLCAMQDAGHEAFAQQELSRMLNSLKALAPEKAEEVTEKLAWNAVSEDFARLLDNPDAIPQEQKDQAVADYFETVMSSLRQLPDMGRNAGVFKDIVEHVIQRFKSDAAFKDEFHSTLEQYRRTGSLPADASDDIKAAFSTFKQVGLLDGMVSTIYLAQAFYMVFGNEVGLPDSPDGWIALVRNVLGAMSLTSDYTGLVKAVGQHLDHALTGLDEKLFAGLEFETPAGSTPASPPPGADTPERLPHESVQTPAGSDTDSVDSFVTAPESPGSDTDSIDTFVTAPDNPASPSTPDGQGSATVPVSDVEAPQPGWDEIFDRLDQLDQIDPDLEAILENPFGELDLPQDTTPAPTDSLSVPDAPRPDKVPSNWSVGLHMVGSLADVGGGVLDIVLGALTIDGARNNPTEGPTDELLISSGSFSVGAGAVSVGSAIAAFVSSAVAGPLAFAAAFFTGISAILGAVAQHTAMQEMTDEEGQWFKDLADDGLLKEDWGDILEFYRYSISWYGDRDAPEDVSMIDYQSEEWKHFQDTEPENGSSFNRLNSDMHIDYDKDGEGMPGYRHPDPDEFPDITLGI